MAFAKQVVVSAANTLVASAVASNASSPLEGTLYVSGGVVQLGGIDSQVFPWNPDLGPLPFTLVVGDELYASGTGTIEVLYSRGR